MNGARTEFRIAVLAGDGVGPEVMAPCLELLDRVADACGGFGLRFERYEAGAGTYLESSVALPEETFRGARAADAILLGAMGLPDVRYPDGTEIAPQVELRERFDLYAGVRPVRTIPGVPTPLSDPRAQTLDFVLLRESTEGLFASRSMTRRDGNAAVYDTMAITRTASERLFAFAFALAGRRRRPDRRSRVTCVDKANIIPSLAFFRDIFHECAARVPHIPADAAYVDATALRLVRSPWEFDVLVTENMFGDILSDLGAALMGGMGVAPSADIGDRHAVFQPCHGTAPDIAGQGLANPTAMFLSAAMMLEWLGERHALEACCRAASTIRRAVDFAFAGGGLVTVEHGGSAGTREVAARVFEAIPRSVAGRE